MQQASGHKAENFAEEPAEGRHFPGRVRALSRGAAIGARRNPFLVLGAVIAVLLLGIGGYAIATWGQESTDDAQIEADVVPLGARISGQARNVPIVDNQAVKRGDLILKLDDGDQVAKLAQAKAELATAQAQADAAKAQEQVIIASAKGGYSSATALVAGSSVAVSGAQAQITAAQAALDRAQAEARKAELDWSRIQELHKSGAIAQQQYDAAQASNEAAQAALAQARANLAVAQEQRRAAESRVAEAEGKRAQSSPIGAQIEAAHAASLLADARVQAAQAALRLAELQLSYTKITAPTDGVISKLSVHPGQLVSVGQPVAELVPDRSYVIANFKETQIERMRAGDRAEVEVDAYPRRPLAARVESFSGGTGARFSLLPPDNATGNFVKVVQRVPVRLAWVNPPADLPLRAGLSATVTVYLSGR